MRLEHFFQNLQMTQCVSSVENDTSRTWKLNFLDKAEEGVCWAILQIVSIFGFLPPHWEDSTEAQKAFLSAVWPIHLPLVWDVCIFPGGRAEVGISSTLPHVSGKRWELSTLTSRSLYPSPTLPDIQTSKLWPICVVSLRS